MQDFHKPKIKVFGVGGSGCNFQEHMISVVGNKLDTNCFVSINTDQQSLNSSKAPVKLQIGPNGLGAGANPSVGREYAEYSENEIKELFKNTDLVIIFAGLGGGTGSGSAPVIARIAREMGVLVFGIVTKPFAFEGKIRKNIAEEAIEEFKKHADVTVVVSNQLLFKVTNQYTTFKEAFKIIDNMCASFVSSILDIFNTNGLINVDFADIETTIKNKGIGLIGVGYATGEDSAIEAATKALGNPLLENMTMNSASNALVHIAGNDISLIEVEEIMKKIHNELGEDVNIIHGMTIGEQNDDSWNFSREFLYPNDNSFHDTSNSIDALNPKKWVRVMIIVTGLSVSESSTSYYSEKTESHNNAFIKNINNESIQNNFNNEEVTKIENEAREDDSKSNNLFTLLQRLKNKKS